MTINVRKPVEARAEAFIANASHSRPADHSPEEPRKAVVNIRFDAALLGRVDADARRLGISRAALAAFRRQHHARTHEVGRGVARESPAAAAAGPGCVSEQLSFALA